MENLFQTETNVELRDELMRIQDCLRLHSPCGAGVRKRLTAGTVFERGQQDPAEFLLYILKHSKTACLFKTTLTILKTYATGKEETEIRASEPQFIESLYQLSLMHTQGRVLSLNTIFPRLECEDVPDNEYGLKSLKTLTEYNSGELLIFAGMRPGNGGTIDYGVRDASTRAFTMELESRSQEGEGGDADVHTMQLCSVVCWRGGMAGFRSFGHYVAYAYDDTRRAWMFYDDAHGQIQELPCTESPETWPPVKRYVYFPDGRVGDHVAGCTIQCDDVPQHKVDHGNDVISHWRPSTFGTMFVYRPIRRTKKC